MAAIGRGNGTRKNVFGIAQRATLHLAEGFESRKRRNFLMASSCLEGTKLAIELEELNKAGKVNVPNWPEMEGRKIEGFKTAGMPGNCQDCYSLLTCPSS